MQEEPFRLVRQVLGPLPILDRFIERIGLPEHITEATRRAPYARALLLLLKNIVLERNALYAIREWAAPMIRPWCTAETTVTMCWPGLWTVSSRSIAPAC